MNFEAIRKYCLSFSHATEDVQWKTVLLFRVGGKIFAMLNLDESAVDKLAFKCHPEIYADLIERDGIISAPYTGRFSWVALQRFDALKAEELKSLLEDSYQIIFNKLPKKLKMQFAREVS